MMNYLFLCPPTEMNSNGKKSSARMVNKTRLLFSGGGGYCAVLSLQSFYGGGGLRVARCPKNVCPTPALAYIGASMLADRMYVCAWCACYNKYRAIAAEPASARK